MTDKPTHHPKPGRIDPVRPLGRPSWTTPTRAGFDPSFLGGRGPSGPKGPKGKPIPLPGKSRGRG